MNFNIKKSAVILVKNPNIMLLLVTYFLIIASILPIIYISFGRKIFIISITLVFLFTCAFFAGWFGMVKSIVQFDDTSDLQTELKQRYEAFKEGFFASIPIFMPALVFYVLFTALFVYILLNLADFFTGKQGEITSTIATFKGNQDAIFNYVMTLPKSDIMRIIKRSVFVYAGFTLYFLFTLYAIPALYFTKTKICFLNGVFDVFLRPIAGLKNAFHAFLKKPLSSFLLFLGITFSHIFLMFFEAVSVINSGLMFLALVLRVTFIAYVVVLLFSVYETNFALDSDNGRNGVRENGSGN